MRKPTNANDGSCKQEPNNICAAETHNGWTEPLLTLGKGDRGRDSRGWLSSQSGTVQHCPAVWYGVLSITLLQHLCTPLVQLVNAHCPKTIFLGIGKQVYFLFGPTPGQGVTKVWKQVSARCFFFPFRPDHGGEMGQK